MIILICYSYEKDAFMYCPIIDEKIKLPDPNIHEYETDDMNLVLQEIKNGRMEEVYRHIDICTLIKSYNKPVHVDQKDCG